MDFGGFVVTLGLRNFHMGGEVKRTFFQNLLDNFFFLIVGVAFKCH